MTHEEAVQFLRQCGREVHLTLLREADRTPTTDLSPTDITPNSSFRPKTNLRWVIICYWILFKLLPFIKVLPIFTKKLSHTFMCLTWVVKLAGKYF